MNGEEAYEAEMESERQTGGEEVRSGVKELDNLLSGSFGGACGGRVVELSGESGHGTGKTALALHIVLSHLSTYELASSIWIDTTGDLSAERITRTYSSQKGPAVHSALERFHISLAFDIDVAYQVLDGIHAALSTVTADQPRPRIVVIDTITPFLGPQLSAVTSQGHATMVTFMRSLRSLAQAHSLSIIVINTSSSANPYNPASVFSTTARKPALGPSFTFLTDATLWMAHPPALTPASTASDAASTAPEAATGPSDPGSLIPSESLAWDNELRVVEVFRSRVSVSVFDL
ncbi:hypothetical protein EWM64_g486 [Hericium alpestre]|uniref:Rad51-like C-terminal domain-containing protein n=1 Tax=Hericium alpestre TaxID=135208 RepID=A0A4Z0A9Z6_9AGAM|nr:hypothetical protein EWM64_g486 [Hericium alpestre]